MAPFGSKIVELAFNPAEPSWFDALACLFLHDPENILHVLGNLVFLAAVGPVVESGLGQPRFIIVYFASGLSGVLAHWAVASATGVSTPLIGASSAIAGCVGYCSVRYRDRRVPLAPKFTVTVGAVSLAWALLQVVGAFVKFGDNGGTSYVAHIGGFVGGVLLAFVFRASKEARTEASHRRIDEFSERSPAAALAIAEGHLKEHPDDPKAMWEKADALHAMGEHELESEVLVALAKRGHDRSASVSRLAQIARLSALSTVERMQYAPTVDEADRVSLLLSVVNEREDEPQRPHALLALAEVSNGDDRRRFLDELFAKYEFHAAAELARARGLEP